MEKCFPSSSSSTVFLSGICACMSACLWLCVVNEFDIFLLGPRWNIGEYGRSQNGRAHLLLKWYVVHLPVECASEQIVAQSNGCQNKTHTKLDANSNQFLLFSPQSKLTYWAQDQGEVCSRRLWWTMMLFGSVSPLGSVGVKQKRRMVSSVHINERKRKGFIFFSKNFPLFFAVLVVVTQIDIGRCGV